MRRTMRLFAVVPCFCWLLVVQAPLVQAADVFTADHVAKTRLVTSVAIAPDGQQVAYTLSIPRQIPKEKDGPAWSELHVVDRQGRSRPFITGEVSVGNVQWTPDGREISFLSKRGDDKFRSIYAISATGGEARKILEHGSNITEHSWSSDGKRLAFLATEPTPKEKKELTEKGFSQQVYEEDVPSVRVWIADVEDKDAKPRMLKLEGSASELHWSPVGPFVAVALAPNPRIDAHIMFRKVRIVHVDTESVVELNNPGKMSQLAWSPDGKQLALVAAVDKYDPREGRLWVAPAAGGEWRDLTPDLEGHVSSIAWQDDTTVMYITGVGVWTTFSEIESDGQNPKTIIKPGGAILTALSLSRDGQHGAFIGETPEHPGEVFLMSHGDRGPRKVTNSNPWLADMRLAKQEVIEHEARDGLRLEGVLVRPLDEKPGQRYPLILAVHGGPEAHIPNGWTTRYSNPGQFGAARGFAVFYPNYRGSTGRGVEFSKMGQRDASGKEFDDLVDAVDHLIKIGLVDKSKVGITGGSYGGYASAWGATYYSERFAAGVMFVGVSNQVSKTGTTDIPYEANLVHHRKWLWEDWDYFLKRSPVYHVEKARTPLLILHGKDDPRVHPGQSLELYRHLKVLGKTPVRLVFYPGEGHGNSRAASRLDYNLRMMRWMEHYLKGPGGKMPPMEVDYGLPKKTDE